LSSEAQVIKVVNQVIAKAVEFLASDIHIEQLADRLRIRYRFDGDLSEAESFPSHLSPAITSRLKILAKLDIAERRLPQDGRIRMKLAFCWVHARRGFFEVHASTKSPIAAHALVQIAALYAIEAEPLGQYLG